MSWFNKQQPQWSAESEKRIIAAIQKQGDRIMGGVNQSAANLAAEETKIEGEVVALGVADAQAFADLKAEVLAEMQAQGIPQAAVDAVTAKMVAFEATIAAQTAATQAADPGTQPAPPATTQPVGS